MNNEIVAHGRVTGIIRHGTPSTGVVTVRKSEQLQCPRCHGSDTEAFDATCSACGVKYHADCLSVGCVSFNCRVVGTVVGGGHGTREDLEDITWGEWTEIAGASVTVSRRRSGTLHGPNPPEEQTRWRNSYCYGREPLQGPNPMGERERYRWAHVTWYEDVTTEAVTYRVAHAAGNIVRVEFEDEDEDEFTLLDGDRLSDEYRAQMLDGDPTDYVDTTYVADMAFEALRDGETIDFAQVWADEVDSILENREYCDLAESMGFDDIEEDLALNEAFSLALGGWTPDLMGQEC